MNFRHIALIAVGTLATALISACGKNGGDSNNTVVTPACPSPYVLNSAGQCVTTNGVIADTNYARFGARSDGTMTITNQAVYQDFLEKGLGVCRISNSSGSYDCKSWGYSEIVIEATGWLNTAQTCYSQTQLSISPTMKLRFGSAINRYSFINGGITVGYGYQNNNNRIFTAAAASVINACQGFEVRQTYNRYNLQVQVTQGRLQDSTMTFRLAWGSNAVNPAQVFAEGTLIKY